MRLHFACIPAQEPHTAAAELNAFLAQHRVVSIDKQLVQASGAAYWSICVTYTGAASSPSRSTRRSRIDYREVLDEHDFALFSELRKLRKELAEREALPAYAIFNNEQLATMVTRRIVTHAALRSINGVGEARVERYGAIFVNKLQQMLAETPDAKGRQSSAD